jgi:hypothetical protein
LNAILKMKQTTYTVEFSLEKVTDYVMEHVTAEELSGLITAIKENDGRINDIIAEREHILK